MSANKWGVWRNYQPFVDVNSMFLGKFIVMKR